MWYDVLTYDRVVNTTILVADLAIVVILIKEYFYDKQLHERTVRRAIQQRKRTVVIDVEGGTGVIRSKPKDINVVINTKSSS